MQCHISSHLKGATVRWLPSGIVYPDSYSLKGLEDPIRQLPTLTEPRELRLEATIDVSTCDTKLVMHHTIHGTGTFTYIYHRNQQNVGVYLYIPYMDGMGVDMKFLKSICDGR